MGWVFIESVASSVISLRKEIPFSCCCRACWAETNAKSMAKRERTNPSFIFPFSFLSFSGFFFAAKDIRFKK